MTCELKWGLAGPDMPVSLRYCYINLVFYSSVILYVVFYLRADGQDGME